MLFILKGVEILAEIEVKDKLKITIKMPKIFGYIYVTTNLIDGKYYIGQHKSDDLNDSYFGSGKYLQRAIKRHGKENFKKEILAICDNQEQLNDREIWFIEHAKAKAKHGNYNIADGGENPPIYSGENHYMWGKKLPEHIKQAISKANTGRVSTQRNVPLSEETKRKISESLKGLPAWNDGLTSEVDKRVLSGESHPQFGIPLSEERKEKIRQHHIKYYSIKENCANYGKTFSQEHKDRISKSRIRSGVAKGENNPMYGKSFSQEHKDKISKALKGKRTGKDNHESISIEAILVDGSIMTFESINLASIYFDINYWTLNSGLKDSVGKDGYYKNRKTGVKFKRMDEGSY